MSQSATIQELKELNSTLAAGYRPADYTVPEGYFDGLAGEILKRIRAGEAASPAAELAELSPFLAGISRKQVYTVPEEYFAELDPSFAFTDGDNATNELAQLSPLLGGLSRKSPFTMPEGYLERPFAIPAEEKSVPRVVMMKPKWYRQLAIAASIAVVITLGATLWIKQRNSTPEVSTQSFAWMEKNMKKVSTEDISKFVDLADPTIPDVAAGGPADDIKGLLNNVSDKEIQDFLKDIPADDTDDDILFN